MKSWDAARVAREAGARIVGAPPGGEEPGPSRASVDSRGARPGDLFVGLSGERADGGAFAPQALAAGAWGVLVRPEHAGAALQADAHGVVLEHPDPLAALQALARAWRRELRAGGAKLVAITGSTGKTSTKDILAALVSGELRTVASAGNLNTEIGLPLTLLGAPADTEVLVVEMAMRGPGQIAELTAIAEPDVGVIVNVGPAHLEQLGSLQAIAAAKSELIAGLDPGATIVIPAREPLLAGHLRADLRTLTFGDGGEVYLLEQRADARAGADLAPGAAERTDAGTSVVIGLRGGAREQREPDGAQAQRITLEPSFAQAHNLQNLLAAVAAARALGITPSGTVRVDFSALRGERIELAGEVVVINDCYNANPMSMRAAIDDLAATPAVRRIAVLGDMLELGPEAPRFHREVAAHASARGIDLLLGVGPLAAVMAEAFAGEARTAPDARAAAGLLPGLLRRGDAVLLKGSRGVGLERVAEALLAAGSPAAEDADEARLSLGGAGTRRR